MFFYEGLNCPVCEKPFEPNEDIVACPQCGLPHHRLCWQQENCCHLVELHNTPEQWSRNQRAENKQEPKRESVSEDLPYQICPRCHTRNPEFAEICTHCGMPIKEPTWYSAPVNKTVQYGEYQPIHATRPVDNTIDPNEVLDGIKAEDFAAVVGVKSEYYLPRFRRISRNRTGGWNWAAFLFGPYWLLYRKMYGIGSLLLILQLIQTIVTAVVYNTLNIQDYTDLMFAIENAVNNASYAYYILSIWILSVIIFLSKVLIGALGNRFYKNRCSKMIQRARSITPDLTAGELTSIGGTTFAIAVIGYFSVYFLTQIIAVFLL